MKALQKLLLMTGAILALCLGVQGSARADVVQDIVKRGELRVAVQTQGPPVSFVDKNGARTGFAVEVVKMMAKDMGVEVKLLDYDWKGLIPAVQSGKADFLAADMTPNAKRTLALSFTEPYLYSDVVLYSKKSQPFKAWQDACKKGVSIGVVQGSSNVGLLKEKCSEATISRCRHQRSGIGRGIYDRVRGLPRSGRCTQTLAAQLCDAARRNPPAALDGQLLHAHPQRRPPRTVGRLLDAGAGLEKGPLGQQILS
jgi:hypothetical protein